MMAQYIDFATKSVNEHSDAVQRWASDITIKEKFTQPVLCVAGIGTIASLTSASYRVKQARKESVGRFAICKKPNFSSWNDAGARGRCWSLRWSVWHVCSIGTVSWGVWWLRQDASQHCVALPNVDYMREDGVLLITGMSNSGSMVL